MAVTTAPTRQVARIRGYQAGELAGNGQGKRIQRGPLQMSFPYCSFDGYYNLIGSHHVQAAACSGFNGLRVSAQ